MSVAAETKPDTVARKPMRRGTRIVLIGIGIIVAVGIIAYGIEWWVHGRFVQDTDDAYLRADTVAVAPKVSGYVEDVYVRDNQKVAAGQPLVRIDARNYQASLALQEASLDVRRAEIDAADRQIDQQRAGLSQSEANLAGAEANAAYAEHEAVRYARLATQGVETQEKAANARNQRDQAVASAKADAAAVTLAKRQIATLEAQRQQSVAQLSAAEAQVKSAQIDVDDTLLRAPIAGRIGDKSVQIGQFVQPGTRLMSVVPVQAIYLVANFKETQLAGMKVGQKADVRIDALGGRHLDAVIDSFAPGTGAEFALLPPENATGNFTKIVQRVPVRLHLIVPDDLAGRLVPGLSATVTVDTTKASVVQHEH
ncbi:MAG TPA: HlyD family secretion protein [Stellaceae bacterium]|jgi:membrane fusion protein (multidrug efflux system)|nr:HlyD family secretion protein [Stellaceae bacterium]